MNNARMIIKCYSDDGGWIQVSDDPDDLGGVEILAGAVEIMLSREQAQDVAEAIGRILEEAPNND